MRIEGVRPRRDDEEGRGRGRRGMLRRFRTGDRVEARIVRRVMGSLVSLDVEGTRLLAWLESEVPSDVTLYLEVVSAWPTPRFRPLAGGASFWSLPVGDGDGSVNTRA